MHPLLNCDIKKRLKRNYAYVLCVPSGDVLIINIPSNTAHCGVHPGGVLFSIMGHALFLYLFSKNFVALLFCPLIGLPLLSEMAKGNCMYCSANVWTGCPVCWYHFSRLCKHFVTNFLSFSN